MSQKRIGFLAQEIEAVIPSFMNLLGTVEKIDRDEDGNIIDKTELLTPDYSRLTTLLWGTCKSLIAQVGDLTARLEALETKKKTKVKPSNGDNAPNGTSHQSTHGA